MTDHHLAPAVERQISFAGLGVSPSRPDLEQDVGRKGVSAGRDELGPFFGILLVDVASRFARPSLDDDFHACLNQQGDRVGDQRNATFAGVTLAGNCNDHGLPNSPNYH